MRRVLYHWFGDHYALVGFTNLFGLAFIAGIGWICAWAGGSVVTNVLIALLGGLIGWALGMLFAPYTDKEAAKFSAIGKTISAFVSGYVISKLDRFLEVQLFVEREVEGVTRTVPIYATWLRLALFSCSILIIMLIVLSNRTYFGVYDDKKLRRVLRK